MTLHPLRRLGAEEIRRARALLAGHGLVGEHTRFAYLGLEEPPKAEVLAFQDGEGVDRRVRAILLDTASGGATDVIASLTRGTVDASAELDTAREGQPPIMLEDLVAVDEIVKSDRGWREAMARRGVTDLDLVRPCPLSAGSFGLQGEEGRRMLRVLSFVQHHPKDHPWAHPVDGLVAYVDLIDRRVLHLIDLHQLSLADRPVVYRASIAEMMVPYADPGPARFWQNYFDAGEYLLGQQVVSLMLGCDCLGEIRYLDAVLPDGDGQPREVPNAICLHEEDVGVAWKHNDLFTGSAETRRMRRLVISSFVAIGNYDYGFFWYLYLDGRIELEIKATGVVFTSAYVEGSRWATEVAPGLGAPYHQHVFSARLDMTVDGVDNAVDEVELERVPVGPDNQHGNAFTRRVTRLARESEAARTADAGAAVSGRAAFATRHLWVTRYDPAERYAAGDLPNQHPRGGRAAHLRRRRPRHRRPGRRPVAHLRDDPLPPPGGLAGDGRRHLRLHPAAGRLLRPQPGPRPAQVT